MDRKTGMNRGTVLLVMSLFLTTVSVDGQQFNAGFFGGLNVSQVSGDPYQGFNKFGFNAGVFVNRLIDQNFYWQAEIKYGTRGVYEGPTETSTSLYRSSYHYLEFPLSVQYIFDANIMLELGTSPEMLITTIFWDENGILDKSQYPENRRFGLSVFTGIGYWLNEKMMVGFRYTNSAIPFRETEEWNNPQYRGSFHNVLSFSLAYKLKHD